MKLPVIRGLIRRRLLVNFRVDPAVMQRSLPDRFRPKLQNGHAIAGICLIRLEHVRPRHVPATLGISSENAAHRVAVTWNDDDGTPREGVYICRRDTSSLLNHLAGGRIFPGEHHRAAFEVAFEDRTVDLNMHSDDGEVRVAVRAHIEEKLPAGTSFASLEEASQFFAAGSLGFSVTSDNHRLDGLRLQTAEWKVEPLAVESCFSSYFSDEARFPEGSIEPDCALLMRDIEHEWFQEPDLSV